MTTTAGIGIHVEPSEISHHYHPADKNAGKYGTLDLGKPGHGAYAHLFLEDGDALDAVIAELVALKQEMDPPVTTAPERPAHRLACGCTDPRCDCPGCQAGTPHEPGTPWNCDEHGKTAVAGPVTTDGEPWTRAGVAAAIVPAPVARVITDSERTCPEQHPGSGAPCHRSGDHGVHRDPDGEEWRTDGEPTAIEPRSGCKCGHTGTVHFLDLLAGGDLTYCHACDCEQYEYVQPASVTA